MKKILFASLLALFLLSSCSTDTIEEKMIFTIDGVSKDFSSNVEITESTNKVVITGKNSKTSEHITLTLHKQIEGNYSDTIYNKLSSSVTRPNVEYIDEYGNGWKYWGISSLYNTNFYINVSKYESSGEVSGTFFGVLEYNWGNGDALPKSIKVENGEFTVEIPTVTTTTTY